VLGQAALGEEQQADTPMTVKTVLRLEVMVAALELQDSSGRLLVQAAMHGVDGRALAYPNTHDVTLGVTKARRQMG
jgi:hypothetical protein